MTRPSLCQWGNSAEGPLILKGQWSSVP